MAKTHFREFSTDEAGEQAHQPLVMEITGMSCGKCVRRVTKVLQEFPNVTHVEVDLDSSRATVQGNVTDTSVLCTAVIDMGFGAVLLRPHVERAGVGMELEVTGMSCGKCVKRVSNALMAQPGVDDVDVDLDSGKVMVQGSNTDAAALCALVIDLGFGACPSAVLSSQYAANSRDGGSENLGSRLYPSAPSWSTMVLVCTSDLRTSPVLPSVLSNLSPPLSFAHSSVGGGGGGGGSGGGGGGIAIDNVPIPPPSPPPDPNTIVSLHPLLTVSGGERGEQIGGGLFVMGVMVAADRVAGFGVALESLLGVSVLPVVDGWVSHGSCLNPAD